MFEEHDSFGDFVWSILAFMWTVFKIFVLVCLFFGIAISQQCQNQVKEACQIVKLCD